MLQRVPGWGAGGKRRGRNTGAFPGLSTGREEEAETLPAAGRPAAACAGLKSRRPRRRGHQKVGRDDEACVKKRAHEPEKAPGAGVAGKDPRPGGWEQAGTAGFPGTGWGPHRLAVLCRTVALTGSLKSS